jgi:hypothetical protein
MKVCNKCGSERIEQMQWVDVNTDEIGGACGSDGAEAADFWCNGCEEHHLPIEKEDFRQIPNGE